MTIQGAIGSYLRGHLGLFELIGESLYPVRAPDNLTPPYVVYECESEVPDDNALDDGLTPRLSMQLLVTSIANDYDQAWEIARTARLALAGFNGAMGGAATVGVEDVKILFDSASDSDAPALGLYVVESRFQVSYPA